MYGDNCHKYYGIILFTVYFGVISFYIIYMVLNSRDHDMYDLNPPKNQWKGKLVEQHNLIIK